MVPDELEITLQSENEHVEWDDSIKLQLHAFIKDILEELDHGDDNFGPL